MKYNRLGSSGLFVSELSLGTMTFGSFEHAPTVGGLEQGEANALVTQAYEAGVNLFDTADVYAEGASETMLGEALRVLGAPRESYLIATKAFGQTSGKGPNAGGASRGHVMDSVKGSLKRLGVEHIDLYQIHGFDPATPIEETLRALDDLVRQGHVRYIGASNWAAWQIAKALGIVRQQRLTPLTSLQAYYSIAGRELERELVPMIESEGVGLLVWSPLAGGFLSGKQTRGNKPPEGSRRTEMQLPPVDEERAFDAIDVLRPIAEAHGASVAQIALAWLLYQKSVTTILVGAKRADQLADNLGAVDITLSDEELRTINKVSALPPEYPGWMLDMWSESRRKLLAGSKR